MDSLPFEIAQHIFKLACTDGGCTGCSLSLTSQGVRAAARTTRFHSISLVADPPRLLAFVALYRRESDLTRDDKARVTQFHLVVPPVSNSQRPERQVGRFPMVISSSGAIGSGPQIWMPPHQPNPVFTSGHEMSAASGPPASSTQQPTAGSLPSPLDDPRRVARSGNCQEAMRELFRLVAPTVETLALQYGYDVGQRPERLLLPIFEGPFPRVREVTVLGLKTLRGLCTPEGREEPLFPSATHLHLVLKGVSSAWKDTFEFWQTHALLATHLRISSLPAILDSVHAFATLAKTIGIPFGPVGTPLTTVPAYPSVRYVSLQPHQPQVGSRWNIIDGADAVEEPRVEAAKAIEDCQRMCASRGVQLVVEEPCGLTYREWGVKVREDWKERIDGRMGIWRTNG